MTDNTFISTRPLTENAAFFRVRISDGKLERLFSLNGMRRFWADLGSWTGLAPDDSPLLIRDVSSQEIYAIDWQPLTRRPSWPRVRASLQCGPDNPVLRVSYSPK